MLFFFFQAEDGIRDKLVTGVQTCALPISLALQRKPGIAAKVSRCVVMGGAPCCEGNVTPAAEYNIWCDPEAARIVLRSELPVELVGWHLCRGGEIGRAHV